MRRFALLLLCLTLCLQAADYYVDNTVGNDAFDGLARTPGDTGAGPKATINAALKLAGPGDTVHLVPTGVLYRQTASFYGHPGGESGRPVTLDGHGATLSGSDPCPADGWEPYRGDTLQRTDILPRLFIFVDGEMIFMARNFSVLEPGEICYMPDAFDRLFFRAPAGTRHADHVIEVGQPDGESITLDPAKWEPTHSWLTDVRRYQGLKRPTWVKLNGRDVPLVEVRDRLEPGQWTVRDGVFYVNPPAGRELAELEILCSVRENGVMLSGETKHVVVRNINVMHVYNDGFNIHGRVTATEFYNCNAWDCGDEGFSAHGDCETLLDGAVFINCDNGISNVNRAGGSITRNVILARSRGVGFRILGSNARHELTNAILVDNPNQLWVSRTTVDNLLIVRRADAGRTHALNLGPETTLRRVTVVGNSSLLRAGAETSATISDSLFGPGQGVMHVRAEDPAAILTFERLRYAPDQVLEWGVRHPWTSQVLAEWLAGPGAARATACEPVEIPGLERLPEGAGITLPGGCSPDLLERYRHWLKTGK